MHSEINISGYRLDIESGTAHQYRNPPAVIDSFHGFFCHLLKPYHIKFFIRLQTVHQMMGDSLHLLRPDLCGTDIHMTIDLHGIR